jgi:nucleoside phosphorylase
MIPADRALFELARDVARDWRPDAWPWSSNELRTSEVHTGIIASADCWTQDPVRIGGLHDLHRSLCEDMEAAAVAQVCAVFKTPMLAIKDISNNELHAATGHGAVGGPTLETVANEIGARAFALVERIVQRLELPASS